MTDEFEEARRQAHNERLRRRMARQAIGQHVMDAAYLRTLADARAELPWWAWRRRRWNREAVALALADAPGWCAWCGCDHRPSDGCPEGFIPATLLGIMTTEGIEEYP